MNYTKLVLLGILIFLTSSEAFAQQPGGNIERSSKYRKIFTIAGGGGGFAVGMFAGLAKFDDAIYSEDKATKAALVGGIGGAVGGYFLGRVLDKRRDRANQARQRTVQLSPLLSSGTRAVHMSLSF
jgi:predicted MFS family arabinose efflux permease